MVRCVLRCGQNLRCVCDVVNLKIFWPLPGTQHIQIILGVSGLGRWGKRERKGEFSGLLLLINTASFSQIDQKTKKWALLQWQGAFEPTRGGFLQRAAWARNHISGLEIQIVASCTKILHSSCPSMGHRPGSKSVSFGTAAHRGATLPRKNRPLVEQRGSVE